MQILLVPTGAQMSLVLAALMAWNLTSLGTAKVVEIQWHGGLSHPGGGAMEMSP